MRKKIALAAVALAVLGGAATTLPSLTGVDTVAETAVNASLAGTVDVGDCSYSLVKLAESQPSDQALIFTNGHCFKFFGADEVIVNQGFTETKQPKVLDAAGKPVASVTRTKILYATMSGTDLTIYQTKETYGELAEAGAPVLELSDAHPAAGADIFVPSSFHSKSYECEIDGFVPQLKEDVWNWTDSVRYTDCAIEPGSSGSPIVDKATGKVIGINNTLNADGKRCALNNPCEVGQGGAVKVDKGRKYGQQTFQVYGCLGEGSTIDLTKSGCTLAKPKQ
ncbi:serine protease [Pseudonocardiaceae bacterium YIM PH 21723]|nr:serine protease [Pseudonocardiaceae bacterium YIM PH 21723]